MQRSQNENERSMDELVHVMVTDSSEMASEEIVNRCAAMRSAIGNKLREELQESLGDEAFLLDVLPDGHWSAIELIFWSITVHRPAVWSALASDSAFAKIALMPLPTKFHGAETPYGVIVWASYADPEELTEAELKMIWGCNLQVFACFPELASQASETLEKLKTRSKDAWWQRTWDVAEDLYSAARFYDLLNDSAGEESLGNDFGSEMIAFRLADAKTLFAQIAIEDLLLQKFLMRTWSHLLEPAFSRWFSESQSINVAARILEWVRIVRKDEELPLPITSRYSESELEVALSALRLQKEEDLNAEE